jgi:hypothetical protein
MKARTITSPWPSRPRRSKHPILGCRQTWLRCDGRARVDRFFGGSREFIALVMICGGAFCPLPASFSKLRTAQAAADRRLAKREAGH